MRIYNFIKQQLKPFEPKTYEISMGEMFGNDKYWQQHKQHNHRIDKIAGFTDKHGLIIEKGQIFIVENNGIKFYFCIDYMAFNNGIMRIIGVDIDNFDVESGKIIFN